MNNIWWLTRPKRDLTSIPEVLTIFAEHALGVNWSGNRQIQTDIERHLEDAGIKRGNGRRLQNTPGAGGGCRTYYAWLKSLGLAFRDNQTKSFFLTLAGEALLNNESTPVEVLRNQVLHYQIPSAFSYSGRSAVHERFHVHPCLFVLRLLMAPELEGYITQDEIAHIVIEEGENDNQRCLRNVIGRIIEYRENGADALADDFLETYNINGATPERFEQQIQDIANTLLNWLRYVQLVQYDDNNRAHGRVCVRQDMLEYVQRITEENMRFVPYHQDEETFQRAYGLLPGQRHDTRNLTTSQNVTRDMLNVLRIQNAFMHESLRQPIVSITSDLIERISENTAIDVHFVEDTLNRLYPHGGIGRFMAGYGQMAFHGTEQYREFEEATANIFRTVFNFNSTWLGNAAAGRQVPDVLLVSDEAGYQAIIDTKAYAEYDLPTTQRDRMYHYIQHIAEYSDSNEPPAFFSYIAGGFSNTIATHLQEISSRTNVNGSAVPVHDFIGMVQQHMETPFTHERLRDIFSLNRRIGMTDIVSA